MGTTEISSWLAGGSFSAGIAEYLVKVTALLLLTWGLSFVLRRASASARHLMWMAALFAVFALPFLSGALPAWRVSLLPAEIVEARSPETWPIDLGAQAELAPALDAGSGDLAVAPSMGIDSRGFDRPSLLVLAWALGAALLGLRLLVSVLSARRLARQATPVAAESVLTEVASLRRKLGIRSEVTVVESEKVAMPMAWGMFRQIIFLPVAASEWSEERRRVVLLHELAHLKRRDCETLMLARVVAALHWFNPLVWVAVRKVQVEREHACDDLVLTAGTPGTDYAHHLLDIARGMRSSFTHGWAMVAMARPSELEGRLLAILDPDLNRGPKTRSAHAVSVLSIALLAVPLAALQPSTETEDARPKEIPTPETTTGERDRASWAARSPDPVEQQLATSEGGAAQEGARLAQTGAPSQPDERLIKVFMNALQEDDRETRAQAAHSLGMIGDGSAIPMLGQVLQDDSAERVRAQAAWALGMIEEEAAVPALRTALPDASSAVRQQVAWALGMIESDTAVSGLLITLTDRDARVRDRAAWALGMIESPMAVVSLNGAVEGDSSPAVRERAVWALGMIGSDSALDTLLNAMTDESEKVRQRALWAVGRIAGS